MVYPTFMTVPCMLSTAAVTTGSTTAATVVVIKGSAGILGSVIVTKVGTGTGSVVFYDNASTNTGTIIGTTTTSALPLGTVYTFNMPAANGITLAQITSGPEMTISYA